MFNLKFALSYFLHQLKAINRHGLHSPFVYRLVDEVIYDFSDKKLYTDLGKALQPDKKLNAADKLLYRIIANWQPQNINTIGKCTPADRIILEYAKPRATANNNAHYDNDISSNAHTVFFLDAAIDRSSTEEQLQHLLSNFQEGAMLVVKNNHLHNKAQSLWQQVKGHPRVTVSVDLFWLGVIYHRPGQVKENFLIKF